MKPVKVPELARIRADTWSSDHMITRTHTAAGLLTATVLAFALPASAQRPAAATPASPANAVQAAAPATEQDGVVAPAGPATVQERAALTHGVVAKWGAYVQRVYGVRSDVWAQRMAPNFQTADADNLRNALKRDTFDGAMAELGGAGARLSDAEAIDQLAKATAGGGRGEVAVAKFGDLTQDVVYTPIQPCRIIDTRSTAAGAIIPGATRSFLAINASNFTVQGGSATNCGTLGLNATAVVINFTAVPVSGNTGGAGHATVYPFGSAQPSTASVNYPGNAPINNTLIAQIPNPIGSFDFTVYSTSRSQFVADIVGYFAPPLATALQCVDTTDTVANVAAGATSSAAAPVCAVGYTQTATNCESSTWQMPFVYFSGGVCSAQNNSASTAVLRASRTCCRVPGR